MIALGTRVYLSCTIHEELVPGHCLIVPIQHCLTMLEGDDDVWDEVKVGFSSLHKLSLFLEAQFFDALPLELYEDPYADVLRARTSEGRVVLRNCHS